MSWAWLIIDAFLILGVVTNADGAGTKSKHNFCGTIVAYDEAAALMNTTSAPQLQVLIVRVEEAKRKRQPELVKVVMKRLHGEPDLPLDLFENGRRWCFFVWSEPDLGEVCKSPLARAKWLDTAERTDIVDLTRLKCFATRPVEVKHAPERQSNNRKHEP